MNSELDRSWQETWLIRLLRIAGAVILLAWFGMVMPSSWMQDIHGWLGLGELASDAITEYLTRSLSALYGIHGGLLVVLSMDVRGLRPVVFYVALMNVVGGACLLGIDLYAGMPWWWTWAEGPPIMGFGVVLLWLLQAVPVNSPTSSA
jgi:hypothetical protein